MDGPWVVYFQNCVRWPRPPSKMAAMSRHSFSIEHYGIWMVKLKCIRHADILKRTYLCQVSDTGSPEPLVVTMLGDIDLIFGMWVYNDELQIKFTFRSGAMIFGRVMALGLKFGQIFSCHHFISLWFEILTWFLVWECIIISYRSTLKFICYS